MVHLSILPLKGNHGGRTYPYAGYLGLSKVTVDGVVRTRLEDDNRPLAASSLTISIRCYEARSRFTVSKVNLLLDMTQTLWTAREGHEYEELGSGDYPFRLSLPSKVGGLSTMQHPEYRVFWRLEAGSSLAHSLASLPPCHPRGAWFPISAWFPVSAWFTVSACFSATARNFGWLLPYHRVPANDRALLVPCRLSVPRFSALRDVSSIQPLILPGGRPSGTRLRPVSRASARSRP
jgi:hypothetical protein